MTATSDDSNTTTRVDTNAPPLWRRLLPIPAGLDPAVVAWLDAEAARRAGPDPEHHPARFLRAARAAQALARLHWAGAAIARAADSGEPPDPRWLRVEAQAQRQLTAAEVRPKRAARSARPRPSDRNEPRVQERPGRPRSREIERHVREVQEMRALLRATNRLAAPTPPRPRAEPIAPASQVPPPAVSGHAPQPDAPRCPAPSGTSPRPEAPAIDARPRRPPEPPPRRLTDPIALDELRAARREIETVGHGVAGRRPMEPPPPRPAGRDPSTLSIVPPPRDGPAS